MKMKKLINLKAVFALALLLFDLPVYSFGDFGGVWSDSLNLSHPTIGLKTGKKGNVTNIEGAPFDFEEIHKGLKKSTDDVKDLTGEHNTVTAGITLIVKFGDRFEAFYRPITEDKAPLLFVSGSVKKPYTEPDYKTAQKSNKPSYKFIGPSEKYKPVVLLKEFKQRVNDELEGIVGKEEVQKLYQSWENSQNLQLTAIKEKNKLLIECEDFDSLYTFKDALDNEIDVGIREANSNFGSSVDSEQFLLAYLKEKRSPTNTTLELPSNLILKCKDLRGGYNTDKLSSLRKQLNKNISTEEDTEVIRTHMAEFQQGLTAYDNVQAVGYILHLHSLNEICCCCAYSLAKELLHSHLDEQLKNEVESPFFTVIASASQPLPNASSEIRHGITPNNKLGLDLYEQNEGESLVKIENILPQKIFLQKLLN